MCVASFGDMLLLLARAVPHIKKQKLWQSQHQLLHSALSFCPSCGLEGLCGVNGNY